LTEAVTSPTNSINLIYIKAAIEAATGVSLTLKEVRQYLLEEGLITPKQAKKEATIFRGYSEFYDYDYGESKTESDPAKELNFEQEGKQNLRFGEGLG
tara:strand:+ start:1239 stop:1532 length:294 start_codon:yes stop_codon:yes gene_type:complete